MLVVHTVKYISFGDNITVYQDPNFSFTYSYKVAKYFFFVCCLNVLSGFAFFVLKTHYFFCKLLIHDLFKPMRILKFFTIYMFYFYSIPKLTLFKM